MKKIFTKKYQANETIKKLPVFGVAATLLLMIGSTVVHNQQKTTTPDNKARTVSVSIKKFQYNDDKPLTVQVGDSVVWVNNDDMPHSATADEFDTGILQPGEKSEPIIFLNETSAAGIDYSCVVHERMKGKLIVVKRQDSIPEMPQMHYHETPSTHSMVVTGTESTDIFLHHIALFNDYNHHYHVTLEARISDPAAQKAYDDFRRKNGDALCIIDPETFILTEIQTGKRTSFKATFYQGQWQEEIQGLKNVEVGITKIIQFRQFNPADKYPDGLTYQLYGNEREVFLAHQVTEAPNFQEVVRLKSIPSFLTPALIKSSPLITIPGKRLGAGGQRTFKTAVLNNSTHIILSPPPRTLVPKEPLKNDEEVEILLPGETLPRKITIGRTIYFDIRILNK